MIVDSIKISKKANYLCSLSGVWLQIRVLSADPGVASLFPAPVPYFRGD